MHMIKKIFIVSLLIFCLYSCSFYEESPDYINKKVITDNFHNKIRDYCDYDLDKNKDWLIGVIYFDSTKFVISNKDKEILKSVGNLSKKCGKNILLVGSISEYEMLLMGADDGFRLSFSRVKSVEDYLITQGVDKTYINKLACGNLLKRKKNELAVGEKFSPTDLKNTAYDYKKINQFVEIVILNSPSIDHKDDCFNKNKMA